MTVDFPLNIVFNTTAVMTPAQIAQQCADLLLTFSDD